MRRPAPAMTRALLPAMLWMFAGNAAAQASIPPPGAGIVIVEPDVVLWSVAPGLHPVLRPSWAEPARGHVVAALHERLGRARPTTDYRIPEGLDPALPLAQSLRLGDALALTVATRDRPLHGYATRTGPAGGAHAPDWTLGPGLSGLGQQGGNAFALLVYLHEGYGRDGRPVRRDGDAPTELAPLAVALLVDLRNGRVVWSHRLDRTAGDVREADGARAVVDALLADLPP